MSDTRNMDVVYVVKRSVVNEELRYSLRSLKNIPHRHVYIVGYKPFWIKNVKYLRTYQNGSKHENSLNNKARALAHPHISDDYIFMNDDFFIVKPITTIPIYHMGTLDDFVQQYEAHNKGRYYHGAAKGRQVLTDLGYTNLKSYELHIPVIINKQKMQEIFKLRRYFKPREAMLTRTFYGNIYNVGGRKINDVKYYGNEPVKQPTGAFLSSSDVSFKTGAIGDYIRQLFPDPGPYER